MLDGDVVAAVGVHEGQPHRVVGPAGVQVGQHGPRPVGEVAGRVGAGQVDEVVGGAGGGVERVHRRAAVGGKQPGGQVVALAVPRGDGGAVRGRRRRSWSCARGDGGHRAATGPVMRSAASRPLISTIGTPTPGCTEDPARTTFSGPRRGRVEGRNGPVCPKVCASANGRAGGHALGRPVQRRGHLLHLDRPGQPGPAARLQGGQHLVAVAGAERRPVDVGVAAAAPVEVRRRRDDAQHLPAVGREAAVGVRRHADQQAGVGHEAAGGRAARGSARRTRPATPPRS